MVAMRTYHSASWLHDGRRGDCMRTCRIYLEAFEKSVGTISLYCAVQSGTWEGSNTVGCTGTLWACGH